MSINWSYLADGHDWEIFPGAHALCDAALDRELGCYCADERCVCHTDDHARVRTPFPLGLGPRYCCNRCARLA